MINECFIQCTVVSFICRTHRKNAKKINQNELSSFGVNKLSLNFLTIWEATYNQKSISLNHVDTLTNVYNKPLISNMWNQYSLCWRSFKETFLPSCCKFVRRLHYHAQPSAEIRGMVLPMWSILKTFIIIDVLKRGYVSINSCRCYESVQLTLFLRNNVNWTLS